MYHARRRRPRYTYTDGTEKKKNIRFLIFIPIIVGGILIVSGLFLDDLATKIAVSDACDISTSAVNDACDISTSAVNDAVNRVIEEGNYNSDFFISYEKDTDGNIKAISSNMANINLLSTEILDSVIKSTDNGVLHITVPAGNLSGINLLLGKGPDIPVDIIMLTSSRVDFKNEIESTGINQTKYQLYLEITMDIDVLIPWGTESATTVTEVLISDTVIVGDVPSTYLDRKN